MKKGLISCVLNTVDIPIKKFIKVNFKHDTMDVSVDLTEKEALDVIEAISLQLNPRTVLRVIAQTI
jgi:hypothetical protein